MNKKLLTISIAAYNVEKYIKNTLDSLLVLELLDDIEVIIVDDGSIDGTYKIAKIYEDLYPNTFKAVHKENGGYGSAVNYTIEHASGKYFKLLDGDDWYDKDGLSNLVNKLKQTDVDMIVTNFCKVINGKTINGLNYKNNFTSKIIGIESININEGIPMHAITYKTDIIRKSKLVLKEHLLYTDNYYVAVPLKNVKNIVFYDFIVYNYRIGSVGQSVDRNVNIRHINDSRVISLDLVSFYNNLDKNRIDSNNYMCIRIASTCVDYIAAVMTLPTNNQSLKMIISFENEIKNISKEIFTRMDSLDRKASKTIKLLRKTNYLAYWPISFVRKFI